MPMPRVFKLLSGRQMPSVGLGTFQMKGDELKEALDFALSIGYRHIDTASSYGNEKEIGEVINDRLRADKIKRKDIFITSKVPRTSLKPTDVAHCVKSSLEDLKLNSLDMLLVHSPWHSVVESSAKEGEKVVEVTRDMKFNSVETWRAFENVHKETLVTNIGVSNFTIPQLTDVLQIQKVPVSNVQLEAHVYYQQKNLKTFCDSHNIVVSAYSPLGAPARPPRHVSTQNEDMSLLKDPLIHELAAAYKRTPAQVLLNFLLKQGMVVLPKSCNRERLKENIECHEWSLSDRGFLAIQALDRGVKFFQFSHMNNHPDYHKDQEF